MNVYVKFLNEQLTKTEFNDSLKLVTITPIL
jgi:hypothetical protein